MVAASLPLLAAERDRSGRRAELPVVHGYALLSPAPRDRPAFRTVYRPSGQRPIAGADCLKPLVHDTARFPVRRRFVGAVTARDLRTGTGETLALV